MVCPSLKDTNQDSMSLNSQYKQVHIYITCIFHSLIIYKTEVYIHQKINAYDANISWIPGNFLHANVYFFNAKVVGSCPSSFGDPNINGARTPWF